MQPESCTYLYDMQQAAERVARYVAGKGFADYAADDMLRSAVERQLAIIGEALNQALKLEPDLSDEITDAARIVKFRNILVHAYSIVSHEAVWRIVETELALLQQEVERLLATPEPEEDENDPA
jgi:uncharacterized protein with HEPN domain